MRVGSVVREGLLFGSVVIIVCIRTFGLDVLVQLY